MWVHNKGCGFNANPTNLNAPPGDFGYRPQHFNLKTIAEDAQLRGLWQNAIDDALGATRRNDFQRLTEVMRNGGNPSKGLVRGAFNAVRDRFDALAEAAGRKSWDRVHHWNSSLGRSNPKEAFDWNNLVPVSEAVHRQLHVITTGQTGGWKMWTSRVLDSNLIPLGPYR